MSYNDEKPSKDTEVSETSIGGLFSVDFKRHDDLKTMLDSSKDNLKLDAMKRIISLMATGKDMSELFPPVVKNVASKNVELKKLVYVYLVRYAEEQQDLALLSISTFQRALKDPNQLIRGSALRVLSSIRVPVIAPILMLSIKEGVVDMSPYVRKTAAHAIPKLYSLDPEHKDCLIEVIEKLLKDKTTLVAGSAVMAFEEVCPDRIDLIHKNFRKLCNLLIDIDEWGQVAVIHMLTRYARTQFLDPNIEEKLTVGEQPFYGKSDSSDDDDDDDDDVKKEQEEKKKIYIMDTDHRLLLRTCKPMLQSRNASVVMAVARLYHHCAPAGEVTIVARALVRILRSHREVQSIVLSNIATMSSTRKGLFEPYLKSFFVHNNDPTHIRLLKLEILTNIAGETSIGTILREFQSYISSSDKQFVASTIQAIGRCASNIPEVTETCLAGLVRLLSNRDEVVVAESVVVIKKLLQLKPRGISDIIEHMARLLDSITVPMARASILWLLGEYAEKVPKIAPDILRKAAKSFYTEEDIVKLQILSLGAKLSITNPKQTKILCQYVLNLAKYDQNYDVRDRARFLRQLIIPGETAGHLHKHLKKIFLASKPPPMIESVFKDRQGFQLGSLSHIINAKANGYQELPDFPEVAPDSSLRNVEVEPVWQSSGSKKSRKKNKKKTFYSDSESGSESDSESESGSEDESETESGSSGSESDDGSESKSESGESGSESEEEGRRKKSDSDKSTTESETESEESDSDTEEELPKPKPHKATPVKPTQIKEVARTKGSPKSNKSTDKLLIFDDLNDTGANLSMDGNNSFLSPTLAADMESLSVGNDVTPTALSTTTNSFSQAKSYELLHRMTGNGLSATYRFTRSPCIYSTTMIAVELSFTNSSEAPISNIHIADKKLECGLKLQEFQEIGTLDRGASISVSIGIDFNDTTQPAKFTVSTQTRQFPVTIKAPVGELLHGYPMAAKEFLTKQSKLRGMNESSSTLDLPSDQCSRDQICSGVTEAACVTPVDLDEEKTFGFAGKTISAGTPVLVTVKVGDGGKGSCVTVNCEKMVISSMLVKEIKTTLLQ